MIFQIQHHLERSLIFFFLFNCQEIEKQLPKIKKAMEKLDKTETVEEGLDILDNMSSNYGQEREGQQVIVWRTDNTNIYGKLVMVLHLD